MSEGNGFGKVILFGEHFVVYGNPGIVSALDLTTQAVVERHPGQRLSLTDRRRGTPGYLESKREQQRRSLELIFQTIGLPADGVAITLQGNLPVYSGIGASAASCVAIARALDEEFQLGLTDEQINAAAYAGETAYHGSTHAGLDNTAATFGGLLWFLKGPPLSHEKMTLPTSVEIVMANSGRVANTAEMIAAVAQRRADSPERFEVLLREAAQLAGEARAALGGGDLSRVGELMNANHRLLQEIGVSCPELDHLVEVARQNGAWGAKSTGAGGGGCIVALTPEPALQARVARAIEKEGFEALRTRVGIHAGRSPKNETP